MRTILSYHLTAENEQYVSMPHDARIRTVLTTPPPPRMVEERITLFAEADTVSKLTQRTIRMFAEGYPMPDDRALRYIGTIQMMKQKLTFHVYEELET